MSQSAEFPQYEWRTARWFTRGRDSGQPTVIVIHDTEGGNIVTSAEDGAAYDTRRTDKVSTHFFADTDSVVQTCKTSDTAYHALHQGNRVGIAIEVCGHASESRASWLSNGRIATVATLMVALHKRYPRIPMKRLTVAQLAAGQSGVAGHIDCTKAFPQDHGTHTDPGSNFPWDSLFAKIAALELTPQKEHKMLPLTNYHLPELKYGMNDADFAGWNTVWRAQKMLGITADGIYGPGTAAAVKKYMGSGDGKTIGLAQWVKLYGLSTKG